MQIKQENKNQAVISKASNPDQERKTLDPATIYPPLDETEQLPIETQNLLKPEQISLLKDEFESSLQFWKNGFNHKLVQRTEAETSNSNLPKQIGNFNVEKINDEILITVEETGKKPTQIVITADNRLKINIIDPEKQQEILNKIFQFTENSVEYSDLIEVEKTMSLAHFRELRKRAEETIQNQENDDRLNFDIEPKAMNLAYDIISNMEQAPEIEGINRQKIFRDAYISVAKDFYHKANPQFQELFKALQNSRVIFLNNKDYRNFSNNFSDTPTSKSCLAGTYFKGVIVFNQELLLQTAANPYFLQLYDLIQREDFTLPKNQEQMIDVLAEYIPYRFGIYKPISPNFKSEKPTIIKQKEMLEHILWTAAYHECLHILSGANKFLVGLDEAATNYFTALATFKERGASAFGIELLTASLDPSVNWLTFIRNFQIDHQLAEEMYFNKYEQWSYQAMLNLFPNKEEEFLKVSLNENALDLNKAKAD
ncbi:MAG: hypothetical protein GX559_03290 [Candidatus Pacebacteria bacterium]|nr:hypothetical protein [Candidatus Paceibacterota bacterium]